MANSLDVGQYIYSRLGWVDPWRLQKLAYYVHAWHLAWRGKPLVPNNFQAWDKGPVEPNLRKVNRYYKGPYHSTELPGADISRLPSDARNVIDSVLEFYGGFSKDELIERVHNEKPWSDAYAAKIAGMNDSQIIPNREISRFYAKLELTSDDTPARPQEVSTPCEVNEAEWVEISRRNMTRWADALALLAVR